jgi:TetR/AcrR family transcriptional repressor of mexCD-oprJ operon
MARDRTALLQAAANVLGKDFGASMQQIAAAAGIGRTTLHREFATREELVEAVAERALEQCQRQFDQARIDDAPVLEAFDALLGDVMLLAQGYNLLLSEPHIYRVPRLVDENERLNARLERFFARGQAEGVFRSDLSARWLVYSVGSQFVAIWWAVQDGYVGAKDAPRILRATVLEGVLARGPR